MTAKVNLPYLAIQIFVMFVVFSLALFLPAGTIAWAAGWAFLIIFFSFTIAVSIWLFKTDPGLLSERMTGLSNKGEKSSDKPLMIIVALTFFAWLAFMPLDAVRFGWSHMPVWVQFLGAAIFISSWFMFYLVYRENPYLSPAVRVQQDRGQTVISTGPYRFVRHPLYSSFLVFVIGTCLLLGSSYGLIFGLALTLMVAVRAVMEERTLQKELDGYDAYMKRVRYRLIPFIW
jgi:protein-S-isoprenylcysteine O-methyltransferase Ste14